MDLISQILDGFKNNLEEAIKSHEKTVTDL